MLIYPYEDNADSEHPATIRFKLPSEMVRINKLELTYETSEFRAYSRAIEGGGSIATSTAAGGAVVKSTSSGGGTTATSSSGGGTSTSTQSGGGGSQTSTTKIFPKDRVTITSGPGDASYSDHTHLVNVSQDGAFDHNHSVSIPAHSHNFSTPNHTHNVTIPSHVHDVSIPNHVHEIDIPSHTHDISIPNHTHEVEHKIVELSTVPSSVTIRVDGNIVPHTGNNGSRINLVDYMNKDSNGNISRGRHEVTITPNGLARIEADLIMRVFIQSHIGGNY